MGILFHKKQPILKRFTVEHFIERNLLFSEKCILIHKYYLIGYSSSTSTVNTDVDFNAIRIHSLLASSSQLSSLCIADRSGHLALFVRIKFPFSISSLSNILESWSLFECLLWSCCSQLVQFSKSFRDVVNMEGGIK